MSNATEKWELELPGYLNEWHKMNGEPKGFRLSMVGNWRGINVWIWKEQRKIPGPSSVFSCIYLCRTILGLHLSGYKRLSFLLGRKEVRKHLRKRNVCSEFRQMRDGSDSQSLSAQNSSCKNGIFRCGMLNHF